MSKQIVFYGNESYDKIKKIINDKGIKKIMVICGKTYKSYNFFVEFLESLNKQIVYFSDFCPNPQYDSVKKAVKIFKAEKCDFIIAIGGGSAIDVAKCVKLYSNMDTKDEFIVQKIVENNVKLVAIPTTAGTGSESTKFAVIYHNNEKKSIEHESALPQYAILDSRFLDSLSVYQRQSTMMDALSHAIEACWSVNSNKESIELSKYAISSIIKNMCGYICNDPNSNKEMLIAANVSGQAINITKTTAAHAMSYKLTSLYGISHGHAVSLCLPYVFRYIYNNYDKCIDIRGKEYLSNILDQIAECMRCSNVHEAIELLEKVVKQFKFNNIEIRKREDLEILSKSVNKERLSNYPVLIMQDDIEHIYRKVLKIN